MQNGNDAYLTLALLQTQHKLLPFSLLPVVQTPNLLLYPSISHIFPGTLASPPVSTLFLLLQPNPSLLQVPQTCNLLHLLSHPFTFPLLSCLLLPPTSLLLHPPPPPVFIPLPWTTYQRSLLQPPPPARNPAATSAALARFVVTE